MYRPSLLQPQARCERGHRALPGWTSPGVRCSEGTPVGRLPEVPALEPDAAGGALGGDRGLRAALSRDAAARLHGERGTGEAARGARAGAGREAAAAGVCGVAVWGGDQAAEPAGDSRQVRIDDRSRRRGSEPQRPGPAVVTALPLVPSFAGNIGQFIYDYRRFRRVYARVTDSRGHEHPVRFRQAFRAEVWPSEDALGWKLHVPLTGGGATLEGQAAVSTLGRLLQAANQVVPRRPGSETV